MEQIAKGIYIEDTYLGVTLGALALTHGTILDRCTALPGGHAAPGGRLCVISGAASTAC